MLRIVSRCTSGLNFSVGGMVCRIRLCHDLAFLLAMNIVTAYCSDFILQSLDLTCINDDLEMIWC